MFPVTAAITCMLGVATKYCQSEKTIVVAFFYGEGSWYRNPQKESNKQIRNMAFHKERFFTLLSVTVSF